MPVAANSNGWSREGSRPTWCVFGARAVAVCGALMSTFITELWPCAVALTPFDPRRRRWLQAALLSDEAGPLPFLLPKTGWWVRPSDEASLAPAPCCWNYWTGRWERCGLSWLHPMRCVPPTNCKVLFSWREGCGQSLGMRACIMPISHELFKTVDTLPILGVHFACFSFVSSFASVYRLDCLDYFKTRL